MPPRVTGALLSTALASGLLLSAVPAHAIEAPLAVATASTQETTTEKLASSAPEASESISAPVEAEETSRTETSDLPAEPSAEPTEQAGDEGSSDTHEPTDATIVQPVEATTQPQPTENLTAPVPIENATDLVPTESHEPSSVSPSTPPSPADKEESAASQKKSAASAAANESATPSETSVAEPLASGKPESFGYVDDELTPEQEEILAKIEKKTPKGSDDWSEKQWDQFLTSEEGAEYGRLWEEYYDSFPQWEETLSEEQRALWEKIEQIFPDDNENWDEAQWEAFYASPEGQELERLMDEFYQDYYGDDDYGFELSDEEKAFYEEFERRLPAGSDEWSEKQWEEYMMTDDGHQLLEFFLTFELDLIESPDELAELIEMYRELYDDGTGWFEEFIDRYLNGPNDGTATQPSAPAKPETSKATPPAEVKIAPAAQAIKATAQRAHYAEHPVTKKMQAAKQASHVLADTGFSSVLFAGGGVLVLSLGVLLVRQARKAAVK